MTRRLSTSAALSTAFLAPLLLITSCAQEPRGELSRGPGTWTGEISTGGISASELPAVRTLAGSAWTGERTLVAEWTIAPESSPESPPLGSLGGIAFDGQQLYVSDPLARVVRIYDAEGEYVRDLGRSGEGPGEFQYPKGIGITEDDRLLVQDNTARKVHVFGPSRQYLESWSRQLTTKIWDDRFLVTPDGEVLVWELLSPFASADEQEWGIRRFGPSGQLGTPIPAPAFGGEEEHFVRWGAGFDAGGAEVPFAPIERWALSPRGDIVVAAAREYRLEVTRADGARLLIERAVDAPPVPGEEFQWAVRNIELEAGSDWRWPSRPRAHRKPFVRRIFWGPDQTIWVLRELEAVAVFPCSANADDLSARLAAPCWRSRYVFDVFEESGKFATSIPYDATIHPFARPVLMNDRAILAEQDDNGNPTITMYRIVPELP